MLVGWDKDKKGNININTNTNSNPNPNPNPNDDDGDEEYAKQAIHIAVFLTVQQSIADFMDFVELPKKTEFTGKRGMKNKELSASGQPPFINWT